MHGRAAIVAGGRGGLGPPPREGGGRGERVALTAPERDEFVDRWRAWNDPLTAMQIGSPSLASGLHARTMPPVTREQREALYELHVARTVLCFDVRAESADGRFVGEARLRDLTWPR